MNDFDKEALLDVLKTSITHIRIYGNTTMPSAQAISWGIADNGQLAATSNVTFNITNSGYVYNVSYQNSDGTNLYITRSVTGGQQAVNNGDVFRVNDIKLKIS